ncbi:unnamed protein product [Lactuca saligna]|uniref:Uncharacterized protein n=1 Tax=Lactuca saligna TaxID=75948 RepID=A0AA35ZGY8_LACSI|nr:unnamed protein product [Lactuca saligna]
MLFHLKVTCLLQQGCKSGLNNRTDDEEDVDKDEEESATDKGEWFCSWNGLPLRMNEHIHFSTTSSSSSFVDDIVPRGSTPPVGDTTKPMIQDELSPKFSPSPQVDIIPQAETVRPMPTVGFLFKNPVSQPVKNDNGSF